MSEAQVKRAEVVVRILTEVGQLPLSERAQHIDKTCGGDSELKAVVDYLLNEKPLEPPSPSEVISRGNSETELS